MSNQEMAMDWTIFGLSLAGLCLFGIVYSVFVRWTVRKGFEGQTAWGVVIGVTATLIGLIPVFGLPTIALIFAGFAASGIPMIVEYILRVNQEQNKDKESAREVAKDLLDDPQAADR